MPDVDGRWACRVDSPMGEQAFILTVATEGEAFAGTVEGGPGRQPIADGAFDGDATLRWTMKVTKPMPVTLACKAVVAGDTLTGTLKAGIFGSFPLTGERA